MTPVATVRWDPEWGTFAQFLEGRQDRARGDLLGSSS